MSAPERPPLEIDAGAEPLEPLAPLPDEPPEPAKRADRSKGSSSSSSSSKPAAKRKRSPDHRPHSSQRAGATRAALERGVSDSINGLAFAVSMIDPEDGAIIAQGEPRLTQALLKTADSNPRFKAWLERSMQGGAYLQLATACGAIVLPIALRHFPMPPAFRAAADLAGAPSGSMSAPDAPPSDWVPVEPVQVDGLWYGVAPDGQLVPLEQPPNGVA